ncbi:MAG TPA: SsgA family sporulation/cell division regulator [Mycobacteriales bacterium]|nr:SsgA family sporulation/cell division regulator [Mycobacteriales bacterium]
MSLSEELSTSAPVGAVLVDAAHGAVRLVLTISPNDPRPGRRFILTLHWNCTEPLEVAITLRSRPDHPALPRGEWAVLRDLLRAGLVAPTGDGDVRLRPAALERSTPVSGGLDVGLWDRHDAAASDRADFVHLELHRVPRRWGVALPAATLASFVTETDRYVPAGAEDSTQLQDALIAQLRRD